MILNSYAKLNLYLKVIGRRSDGFHDLSTVFERINLADKIILKNQESRIDICCKDPGVPLNETNLCHKSALLLRRKYGLDKGVSIEIIKRIPVGAGLGGGSSNAASVLLGLNKLWKLGLSLDELASCAAQIGSDVPFFVYNTPFALGEGRGHIIRPIRGINRLRLWHVLAVPGVHVSTARIYAQWDAARSSRKRRLTSGYGDAKITANALKTGDFSKAGCFFNSLEAVTINLYPEVGVVKDRLLSLGACFALMSGSGSAVFTITASRAQALRLKRRLAESCSSWQIFLARTR